MQSVKIITTSSTATTSQSGIIGGTISSSPTTITSTTESSTTIGQQNVASDHLTSSTIQNSHHHRNNINNNNNISCHHGGAGKGTELHQFTGLSCNVSSSSIPAIGICATIAFMDIKSASKAHIAEHKFDDRILTTEYYEPSTMQLHNSNASNEGGCNLVVNNKTSENNVIVAGDIKQETHSIASHGRYTSTSSSSHGLVQK